MTKEELYKEIINKYVTVETVSGLRRILDTFFESNICIPKGTNRHPYADVYHEAVEGKP
jgi:anionic cell wall polymer biosynthesis LytR-Cps2A-Psr (LCP) family protein